MKLSDVKINPKNPYPAKSDEEFKHLVAKIKKYPKFLKLRPIVYDPATGIILGGNKRYAALIELGHKEVPDEWIVSADDLSEEEKQNFIFADNKGYGAYDFDFVSEEMAEEWSIEFPEDEEKHIEAEEDDFDTTPPAIPKTVLGDLYEIGEHRLLCGDSTDSDTVAKLMDGQKADLAHNDPPYGMKKEKDGVLNDNLNYADLLDFNKEWIALQFSHIKDNGSWYCWGIDEPLMDIYSDILKPYISQQKATFRNLITWFKNPSGLGDGQNNSLARSYGVITEKCLFVMMGVQGFNNNADNYFEDWETIRNYLEQEIKKIGENDKTIATALGFKDGRTVNHWWSKSQWSFPTKENYQGLKDYAKSKKIDSFKKEYDQLKKEYDQLKKEYYSTRAYFNNTHDLMTEVWQFDRHKREGNEGEHATPKPIPLCERAIKSSCPENGLVIDFFTGSGSTMVAAHQLNRKCFGMELEPKYVDVCVKRMKALDPKLTIKRNGKDISNEDWLNVGKSVVMAGGKGNIKPEDNPKPFTSDYQPNNTGRKPSIKNQLKDLALSDGKVTYKPEQVDKVHDDGSVTIKIPKQELLAQKLWSWAMSKRGGDSIKAIQMIMEQFDGKGVQPITTDTEQLNWDNLTADQLKQYKTLRGLLLNWEDAKVTGE